MLNQYSRTRLLLGAEGMERLAKARVAIFGIGGVGGFTMEALARSGIGRLILVDGDVRLYPIRLYRRRYRHRFR